MPVGPCCGGEKFEGGEGAVSGECGSVDVDVAPEGEEEGQSFSGYDKGLDEILRAVKDACSAHFCHTSDCFCMIHRCACLL